jgi:citrate lyase subunit beta / citryl-CoA lyase
MPPAGIHEKAARLMRSLLFVPGDSTKKLEKSLSAGADALVLDLEDSVAANAKEAARGTVVDFLNKVRDFTPRPKLYVRVNALGTGLLDGDLDAVLKGAPDGIMLPKCGGGADATLLDAKLAAREAIAGLPDGSTRLIVLATETPAAIFTLGTYRGATKRLEAMAWAGEDLSAAVNAETNRLRDGSYAEPYRVVRALCLFAAVAAEVLPVDTVYPNFRDLDGLRVECEEARRDGYCAKMAIHPAQVPVINGVFTPAPEAVARAKAVVAAFTASPGAGVVSLDGAMLDRPHLIRAERLIAQARAAGLA